MKLQGIVKNAIAQQLGDVDCAGMHIQTNRDIVTIRIRGDLQNRIDPSSIPGFLHVRKGFIDRKGQYNIAVKVNPGVF